MHTFTAWTTVAYVSEWVSESVEYTGRGGGGRVYDAVAAARLTAAARRRRLTTRITPCLVKMSASRCDTRT